MAFPEGSSIGPYEIQTLLGSGGMGEVYRAWDPRLARPVALKLLHPALAEGRSRQRRFEQEARLVAQIQHPSVLQVFDTGLHEGLPYLVTELLEGRNLRERLKEGPIPWPELLPWAVSICQGLGVAHQKGIVHRDLKPENIFLTLDGRVVLLDFGLAKLLQSESEPSSPGLESLHTEGEFVLGTVPYLSPEQVAREEPDPRSDLFSLGIVLWEALTGRRPFQGTAPLDCMYAIARLDLPQDAPEGIPESLRRILHRCLQKQPSQRFQSALDLAFALQASPSPNPTLVSPEVPMKSSFPRPWRTWLFPGIVLLSLALGYGIHPWLNPPKSPSFIRLNHAPGSLESARFSPDGQSHYFSLRHGDGSTEVFLQTPTEELPRGLGVPDAQVLSVSPKGEVLLLREARRWYGSASRGRLALMPAGGGAFRDLQEQVMDAAWDARGQNLAIVTLDDHYQCRLEAPQGQLLRSAPSGGSFRFPRWLGSGGQLAILEADGSKCSILLLDPKGTARTLYTKNEDGNGESITGLCVHPWTGELWFSEFQGHQSEIWALTPRGNRRKVWRGEGRKQLLDISPQGRLLLASHRQHQGALLLGEGGEVRDLSIGDGTQGWGLSSDGRTALLMETPSREGGTAQDRVYVRHLESQAPVRLARGTAYTLSHADQDVQVFLNETRVENLEGSVQSAFWEAGLDPVQALDSQASKPFLLFVPIQARRPWIRPLPEPFRNLGAAYVLPDGESLVFTCSEADRGPRVYRVGRKGGLPQALTPEGMHFNLTGLRPLSKNGQQLLLRTSKEWYWMKLPGEDPKLITGIQPSERLLGWTEDARGLFLCDKSLNLPLDLRRLDLVSGQRQLIRRLQAPPGSGITHIWSLFLNDTGEKALLNYEHKRSELYRIEGL